MFGSMEHFTQTDEQPVILRELADLPSGRFLDLGAYDGQTLSNTRALALSGWWGTLVEPNPRLFMGLLQMYGQDSRFTLINAAMSDKSGLARFYVDGTNEQYCSSIAPNAKDLFPLTPYPMSYLVSTITPKDLTETYDFISIDTEGFDLEILKAMRGTLDSTRLICIEYNEERSYAATIEELRLQGFEQVHKSRENILAKRV
jgi:FkbM family methyltransferase